MKSRTSSRKFQGDTSRVPGGFVALPWAVIDSPNFRKLSYPARTLLIDIARQHGGDNNGQLLASFAYLRKRGWKSSDTIHRAKQELIAGGFIFETVKGHRPNKASWYALTHYALSRNPKFDYGAYENFERGAYRKNEPLIPTNAQSKQPQDRHSV